GGVADPQREVAIDRRAVADFTGCVGAPAKELAGLVDTATVVVSRADALPRAATDLLRRGLRGFAAVAELAVLIRSPTPQAPIGRRDRTGVTLTGLDGAPAAGDLRRPVAIVRHTVANLAVAARAPAEKRTIVANGARVHAACRRRTRRIEIVARGCRLPDIE